MHNIWIALSWSAAVIPAYLLVAALDERLKPYGTFAQIAAFVGAWFVLGRVMAEITRVVLAALGRPVEDDDPAAVERRTRRDLEAGRITAEHAHLRLAAIRIAEGKFAEALIECDKADDRGAMKSRPGQSRFLRARALEGAGRIDEAAERYRAPAADPTIPRVHRVVARVRLYGIEAAHGASADEFLTDFAALLDAPAEPTNRQGAAAAEPAADGPALFPPGADGKPGDEELEFYADAVTDACRSPNAAAGAKGAIDLLLTRARSGRAQRMLRAARR
jgi:hypothetical protein